MANRFPLVVASSTVQEIASGDNLDLTGTGILNVGVSSFSSTVAINTSSVGIPTSFLDFNTKARQNALYVDGGVGIGSTLSVGGDIIFGIRTPQDTFGAGPSAAPGFRIGSHTARSDSMFFVENDANSGQRTINIKIGVAAGSTIANAVIMGTSAGVALTSANAVTFLGNGAGASFVSGNGNTVVGSSAGTGYTTGSNNTIIGREAANNSGVGIAQTMSGSNNLVLGANAQVSSASTSNEITLGDSNIVKLRCQVTTITSLSDERDKTDITDIPLGLDYLSEVRPVKFVWNQRDGGRHGIPEVGFIAQELKSVTDKYDADWLNIVSEDNPDRLEASPGKLLPILVKAIQELKAEVDALKASK